jgi:tetratricopeptide (TPR) repeat protein
MPAALLLIASMSMAAGTPPPPRQQPPQPPEAPAQPGEEASPDEKGKQARAAAEQAYAKGYDEVQEAKALKKAGKEKDAKKKFGKALKRFDDAVRLDEKYFEAWNMLGYCARHTGDLKRGFDAYQRCLAINPEYEEAHEYLGEAYLMQGNVAKAKEQLAWLKSRNSDEAAELEEEIAKAESKAE